MYGRAVHGSLFLDPTRPGETLTRPDPTRPAIAEKISDPTRGPTLPLYVYIFNLIIIIN